MQQYKGKDWWGRNWKWFVPVGCLGSLIVFAGFLAMIFFFVFGLMKSSDPYKEALAMAKAHPIVQETLGTPIEAGLFTMGNISTSGPSGEADLSIPISGPYGGGTLFVTAEKAAGKWTYSALILELEDPVKRIDLLE